MSLNVFVTTLSGRNTSVQVGAATTVESVKQQLSDVEGVDVTLFDLLYSGDTLKDGVILLRSGITEGSELEMVRSKKAIALQILGDEKPTEKGFLESVHNDDVDRVTTFLDAGISPDFFNDEEYPLLAACMRNDEQIIEALLKAGASTTFGEEPLLLLCSKNGLKNSVEALIIHSDVKLNEQYKGATALHVARDPEITELLISHNVDINIMAGGRTALHEYTAASFEQGVALLVDAGAEMVADARQQKPIHLAANPCIAEILLENGSDIESDCAGDTPLIVHARSNNYETCTLLINRGADVNARGQGGYTALHHLRDLNTVKLLVEKGALIDAKTDDSLTPLLQGMLLNNCGEEITVFLLESGADVNISYLTGLTPLHCSKTVSLTEALLRYGADINAQTDDLKTPLMSHLSHSSPSVATLIKNGADLDKQDLQGNTALHYVKDIEITRLLLEKGASLNIANNLNGSTPLHAVVSARW